MRERFGKSVSRGVSDLGTKRATHSPISSLIDNNVIEVSTHTLLHLKYMFDSVQCYQ